MKHDKELMVKILFENLIGVNKQSIKNHHDFLPSVLKAMEKYADSINIEKKIIKKRTRNEKNIINLRSIISV